MSNITNTSKVHDVMVRAIFSANDFDLLGGVRQKMLAESFSFVPVRIDGEWKLIEDIEVARYLRQKGKSEVGVSEFLCMRRVESYPRRARKLLA